MELHESRILLVDDEPGLCLMVKELLEKEGYRYVDTAGNLSMADYKYRNNSYQIVILDVMLPDGDGFSLFETWQRNGGEQIPVIFLSARDEDKDRLLGLGLGADDYITKPFLPEELLLRLKAVLKRTYRIREKNRIVQVGDTRIDFDAGLMRREENEIELTAKEYLLLKKLCDNRGKIVSINVLMDTLWPDGSFGYENSLMVHVRRLREKLEKNPSKPEYLLTVRGLGYKLK